MSESSELAIGEEHYLEQRQLQQGDYVVSPELTQYVQQVGNKLAAVSDRPLAYEFVIVNSSDFNAWALPGGKIGINRGVLVNLECESELAAILSHEIIHAAARHHARNRSKEILLNGARLASSIIVKDRDKLELTLEILDLGGNLMLMKYSRDQELEADYYGMKYMIRAGFNPSGMLTIQKKMAQMAKDKTNNWLNIMLSTHPPSAERVIQSQRFLFENKYQDTYSGCDAYAQATEHLKQTAKAYDYYDKSLIALSNSKISQASRLLDKAIKIEPRESLFYSLKAQIYLQKGKIQRSVMAINKALKLNSQYWQHYFIRGSLQNRQGKTLDAIDNFEKSIALLPTMKAYYSLGELSLSSNQKDMAIEYFWKAWNPETELGVKAGKMVARLDLKNNPQNFLDTSIDRDDNKNLVIQIINNAELPVKISEIDLFKRKNWLIEKYYDTFSVNEQLEPGEVVEISTSIGPIKRKKLRKYSARVTVAEIIE